MPAAEHISSNVKLSEKIENIAKLRQQRIANLRHHLKKENKHVDINEKITSEQ